jgi:DNA-binding transcriptional LysR family regulator
MEPLDIFIIVVEQRSLNKASQLLNLSQPALSRKIANLEDELGVSLFERRGKRLVLTRAGQMCYDHALEMRRMRRNFREALRLFASKGPAGSLTIGASLTTLQSTLPDLITLYTQEYPETDIKAVTGKTHEIVTLVQERKTDIGLVASRIDHPGVHCLPLFDDHLCLVLPENHRLLGKTSVHIQEIDRLPMILFSRGTWYRILVDELFHRYAVFPDVRMEIDSFEATLRLVAGGKTATLLPKSYLRRNLLENNGLAVRNIPELELTKRTTSLIYVDSAAENPAVRRFAEKALAAFPPYAQAD